MGVEQVYYDHFIRAREYGKPKSSTAQPCARQAKGHREGAVLWRLAWIWSWKRSANPQRGTFVTCHSYRQDEINMLMRGRFAWLPPQHLHPHSRGYKVADEMAEHGAGGSSFSDWWAYKYEKDAIPYNGAVLHNQGVVTAFNSDDAEMARA